jgi:hypothetical protein
MSHSEQINELASALAKAQAKMKPAAKNKKNPHFKSIYADLDSIWEACREALSENGLSVTQTMAPSDHGFNLVTTLMHASGQWIKSEMPVITQKQDPQGIGAALTYYRRYALASMVGVAPGEDIDAEDKKEERHQAISKEQVQELWHLIGSDEELSKKVFSFNGIARLEDMPIENYDRVVKWLRTLKAKANV